MRSKSKSKLVPIDRKRGTSGEPTGPLTGPRQIIEWKRPSTDAERREAWIGFRRGVANALERVDAELARPFTVEERGKLKPLPESLRDFLSPFEFTPSSLLKVIAERSGPASRPIGRLLLEDPAFWYAVLVLSNLANHRPNAAAIAEDPPLLSFGERKAEREFREMAIDSLVRSNEAAASSDRRVVPLGEAMEARARAARRELGSIFKILGGPVRPKPRSRRDLDIFLRRESLVREGHSFSAATKIVAKEYEAKSSTGASVAASRGAQRFGLQKFPRQSRRRKPRR